MNVKSSVFLDLVSRWDFKMGFQKRISRWDYSPAMIWTVILSLMPSVGPQVYLLTDMYHIRYSIFDEKYIKYKYFEILRIIPPEKGGKKDFTCHRAPFERDL